MLDGLLTRLLDKLGTARAYLAENASSLEHAKDLLHRILAEYTRKDARDGLLMLLSTLK